ncbi:MAG: NAD(P)H-hydrate dehydratase [Burkholderiales bacterium]
MSSPIYLTDDIRRIEREARDTVPPLMERAGIAAAELATRLAGDKHKDILVLAGPGNNGGDARIAAARLQEQFHRVTVVTRSDELREASWSLVVDGLFGIGLARDIDGDYAQLVDYANRQRCPVLALDMPSGLHSDSGRVMGRAIRASHTITFIGLKPGLLTLDGPDHSGEISVADLGLPAQKANAWVASRELFASILKRRPRNFHKGMAGSVAILGGASGMAGASLLAGRAALKLGAGRVYVGMLDPTSQVDATAPELMLRHADDALGLDLEAIVVGPGLGDSERADTVVGAVLASELPCVLDADALNLISENADLRRACARRRGETIVTPHPAEAGRLLGTTTAAVQHDRVKAARVLADNLNAHVVLKGNGSILVARDGHWFVNRSGNPGMASAGMGDVLAGMLGGLLAQGYSGEAALVLATHLHGAAADALAATGVGPIGMTASEVIDAARRLWNQWL